MLLEIIKKIIIMVIIMIIAAQNHYKNWGHDKFWLHCNETWYMTTLDLQRQ